MTSDSLKDLEEQGRGDPAATGGHAENLPAPDGSANVVDGEMATLAGVPEPGAGEPDGSEAAQWDVASQDGKRDDPLLASLVTLIGLRDRPMSAEALIAGLPLPDSDLTPELFVRAAERAGLNAKLVKRRIKQISNLTLPCVLLLSPRSACVLVRIDKRNADIIFPESGDTVTRVPVTELAKQYLGYALFAQPQVNLESRAMDVGVRQSKAWFWGTLARFWPIYASVAFAALLINVFALVTPLFIMNVYDRVVPNNAVETLWVLAIGVATVFVFDFVLRILRSYFADAAGRSADTLIASRMFEQVMGMKMSARPQSAGAMASHLREFETLRDFFTSVTLTTLIDLPFVFLFIAMIWFVGGPLAYVPLIAVPIVLFVGLIIQIPLTRVVRRTFNESAHKHGILFEAIGGLETVKSMGAEGLMQRKWENEVGRSAKSAAQARSLSTVAISLAAFSQNIVTVGVVVYGVYQIGEGLMTVGALVAATILAGRTMAPLAQIAGLCTRFQQSRAALKALDQIMKMPV
ncbi:MAG: type I secretion system permease/ATPase, partial [Proteobacteria bacterium]|nr:type I secretion system permease/ATPase [Pseudomonadota bacterium]